VKWAVERSAPGKIGMWLAKPALKKIFREKLDPSAYGGAPLLGLNHVAIVCHGSARGRAIMNGVRVAHSFVNANLVRWLEESLATLQLKGQEGFEDGMWARMGQKLEKRRKGRDNSAESLSSEEKGGNE
jgi:fatty acid/phospholipid biosynthesis enzyme